jgi:hypothetical protein
MTIDELLANLQVELKDIEHSVACYERQAETERQAAALLSARIQGIQQAVAVLGGMQAGLDDGPPLPRKRRDIRGAVREAMTEHRYLDMDADAIVADMAKRFECRPYQVEQALKAMFESQPDHTPDPRAT